MRPCLFLAVGNVGGELYVLGKLTVWTAPVRRVIAPGREKARVFQGISRRTQKARVDQESRHSQSVLSSLYSCRNASSGSTCDARQAGKNAASKATVSRAQSTMP